MNRSLKQFLDDEYDEPAFVKRGPRSSKRSDNDQERRVKDRREQRRSKQRETHRHLESE